MVGDVLFLAGVGCVLTGLWWVSPPAALIIAGLLLMTFGVLAARNR